MCFPATFNHILVFSLCPFRFTTQTVIHHGLPFCSPASLGLIFSHHPLVLHFFSTPYSPPRSSIPFYPHSVSFTWPTTDSQSLIKLIFSIFRLACLFLFILHLTFCLTNLLSFLTVSCNYLSPPPSPSTYLFHFDYHVISSPSPLTFHLLTFSPRSHQKLSFLTHALPSFSLRIFFSHPLTLFLLFIFATHLLTISYPQRLIPFFFYGKPLGS